MKISKICFNLSIPTIKLCFTLILALQAFKSLFIDNNSINKDSKEPVLSYQTNLKSNFQLNNESFLISTLLKHSSEQLNANRTQTIYFLNDRNQPVPVVITKSYIDFTQLLNFNNLKHSVKFAMFLDLNIACCLVRFLHLYK